MAAKSKAAGKEGKGGPAKAGAGKKKKGDKPAAIRSTKLPTLAPKKVSLKTKRRLAKKAPQVVEGPKVTLFLKGNKVGQEITRIMTDLRRMKAPHIVPYSKKNDVRPFEDCSSLEFFSSKTECAMVCFASHTKKRPHNLVLGRLFDHKMLDMYEFGVSNFRSHEDFKGTKPIVGSKPCILFQGEKFEFEEQYKRLQNFFVDFFHAEEREFMNLASMDRVILVACSPVDDSILLRHYLVELKKSGSNLPRVELREVGPAMDLTLRRSREAPKELWTAAMKRPKEIKPKKIKNVSTNLFGQKLGTVHMHRQDFAKLQVKKSRALQRSRDGKKKEEQPQSSAK